MSNIEVTTEYDRFLGVQVFEISEEILVPLLGTVVQAYQTLPRVRNICKIQQLMPVNNDLQQQLVNAS